MKRIATHDSVTGESGHWLTWILTPFARTQTKNLWEQYYAGCRLFDIRVKKFLGEWRGAHGWWFTREPIEKILATLASLPDVKLTLTYEGRAENAEEFCRYARELKAMFPEFHYGPVCSKYSKGSKGIKVQYETLIPEDKEWLTLPTEQAFLPLDGKHWQTYLPIPRLWKLFYFRKVEFTCDVFKFVDFL